MKRKEFIKKFAIGGSILFTAPVIFSSCSDDTDEIMEDVDNGNSSKLTVDLNAAANSALKTVGGFIITGKYIVIRSNETTYIALAKSCPHQGYDVKFDSSKNEVQCTSNHGSTFSISGSVTNGPAETGLKKYDVSLSGNILTIG